MISRTLLVAFGLGATCSRRMAASRCASERLPRVRPGRRKSLTGKFDQTACPYRSPTKPSPGLMPRPGPEGGGPPVSPGLRPPTPPVRPPRMPVRGNMAAVAVGWGVNGNCIFRRWAAVSEFRKAAVADTTFCVCALAGALRDCPGNKVCTEDRNDRNRGHGG
jgi:hypothetical protein